MKLKAKKLSRISGTHLKLVRRFPPRRIPSEQQHREALAMMTELMKMGEDEQTDGELD